MEDLYSEVDRIVGIKDRLTIEPRDGGCRYISHYHPDDEWICVAGWDEIRKTLPFGLMPPLEGESSGAALWFGGLSPESIIKLWEKLRPLVKGKVEYSFNLRGSADLIPEMTKLVPGPYINSANGVCGPPDLGKFRSIEGDYTCIPLGQFDLKSCPNEVWMDAIKVPGGWQLYFPASELPNGIPKKKRPAILAELCEILQAPDLFPPGMVLPLDGKTF